MEENSMSGIKGKVIAITGASSGIGEAAARLVAQKGAHVVLGARRTDKLEALVSAIRAEGGSARYRALDVTKREDVEAFVNFAQSEFGKVDVVINNATNARVGLSVTIHISELEGRPVLGRGVSLLIRKRGRPHRETPEGAVAQPQRAKDTGVSPRADIANTIAIDIADSDCFVIARKLAPSGSVREFGENKAGRNEAPFRKCPAGDTRDRIQRNKLE